MKKPEIITFKVDHELFQAVKELPNRSEFIRNAVLDALGSVCPLCNGRGALTANQKRHWDILSADHAIKRCGDCDERVLVCLSSG